MSMIHPYRPASYEHRSPRVESHQPLSPSGPRLVLSVASAAGTGATELSAFDDALLRVGAANYNLGPRCPRRAAVSTDRRLCIASLVVCGMFVTEDPAIAALRSHESGTSQHRMVLDGALALFMIAYNFACSRYVVAATSSAHMLDAIAEVDARSANRVAASRSRAVRLLRSSFHHLNPFGLIKMAGDRLSRSISRATSSSRLRRFGRLTTVLEDLGAVSVLGVPGAGLALGTHGHRATRWRSLRHSALFTASWFVGARLIGWTVRGARIVPYAGVVVTAFTRFVGATFQLLTDVTSPVGAITLLAVAVAVVRYALAVERAIAAAAGAVPNSSACRSDVMVLSLVGAGAAGA